MYEEHEVNLKYASQVRLCLPEPLQGKLGYRFSMPQDLNLTKFLLDKVHDVSVICSVSKVKFFLLADSVTSEQF